MIASTHEKFAAIEIGRGLTIRTAVSLKELITELALNSGEEIGLWIEGEGKRIADIWRATLASNPGDETLDFDAKCNEPGCEWTGYMDELVREPDGVTHCPVCNSTAISEGRADKGAL